MTRRESAGSRWTRLESMAAASSVTPVSVAVVLVIVAAFGVVVVVGAAQVVSVDVPGDVASQIGARFLIEAKMNAAIDARVGDVVGDLAEAGVMESQSRLGRIRHGDRMVALPVSAPQNFGSAVAGRAVIRRIARETRREYIWHEGDITFGSRIAVDAAVVNCRLRPPELVVVLRPE